MNDFPVIFSYSRKETVADGMQITADPQITKEAGIRYPVYLTSEVWDRYVEFPEDLEGFQDTYGRLWDILAMFVVEAKSKPPANTIFFYFMCLFPDGYDLQENEKTTGQGEIMPVKVTLKAMIGPNDIDDPSPAITIMLPNQD